MTETPPAEAPVPWYKKPVVWLGALGTLLLSILAVVVASFGAGQRRGRQATIAAQNEAADQVEHDIAVADATIDARAAAQHAAIDREAPRKPSRANIEASMAAARGGSHAGRRD